MVTDTIDTYMYVSWDRRETELHWPACHDKTWRITTKQIQIDTVVSQKTLQNESYHDVDFFVTSGTAGCPYPIYKPPDRFRFIMGTYKTTDGTASAGKVLIETYLVNKHNRFWQRCYSNAFTL